LAELNLDFSLEVTGFEMAEIDLLIEGASGPEDDPADQVPEKARGPTVTILNKTAEAEKGGRHLIEAFDRQVTQLQAAIAAYEEKLARTIPADGLGDQALAALGIFRARLARGEGIREAALGTAGYNPLDVEAAMGKQDRDEMRAFEALLARSSWRRRLVLRLLGATNK